MADEQDGDIVIVSTTDTQEAVDRAAGITEAGAETGGTDPAQGETEGETPSGDSTTNAAEGAEGTEAGKEGESETVSGKEPAKQEAKTTEEDRGKKGDTPPWLQKRIDRATKKQHEAEERERALREEVETLRKEQAKPSEGKADAGTEPTGTAEAKADDDPEPKEDDFPEYANYIKALGKWSYRQAEKDAKAAEATRKAEEAKATEAERQKKVFDTFLDRQEEARERYDDYDEVIAEVAVFEGVQLALVEAENGPDIAYYLGKHPEEAERLRGMSLLAAIAAIGRIGERLTAKAGEAPATQDEAAPTPKTPTKQSPQGTSKAPVSSAPAPITPVGGSGAHAPKTIYDFDDNSDQEEYKALRAKQTSSGRR